MHLTYNELRFCVLYIDEALLRFKSDIELWGKYKAKMNLFLLDSTAAVSMRRLTKM